MADKNQLIEMIYEEELVHQAEILFEANAVYDLANLPSNLFVCKVKDGKLYEVEIQSPFAKKQTASCECSFYIQNKICKHIIASLLLIRLEQNNKAEQTAKGSPGQKKQKLVSLNINHILQEIDHEELLAFVKAYARTDKRFSTQLKVSFARKIDLQDNSEKYKNILNAIVRPNTGSQSRASAADIRAIIHVLQDFVDQINDCVALGQYREAFNIYTTAFAKLEYVRHYYDYQSDVLKKLSETYHEVISYILNEKLPPELFIDIQTFLLDMGTRSYYHFEDVTSNILTKLFDNIKSKELKIHIQETVSQLIENRDANERIVLMAMHIRLSGKYGKSEIEYFKQYQIHLIEIADLLLACDRDVLAVKILEAMMKPSFFQRDIANRLIFLYVRLHEGSKLSAIASKAYIRTGDMKYIDILAKEVDDDTFSQLIDKIETDIIDNSGEPSLLIKLYKRQQNWIGMLHFLASLNDVEVLKEYDEILYKNERAGLIEVYKGAIISYLDEHLGDISYDYMLALKQHFTAKRLNGLMTPIQEMLKNVYPMRPKIIEIFS